MVIFITNISTSYAVISLGSQVGELFWCHARALRFTIPWWRCWGRSRTILGCIADSWLKTTCILIKFIIIVEYLQWFVIETKWNWSDYYFSKYTQRTYATFPKLFGINWGREVKTPCIVFGGVSPIDKTLWRLSNFCSWRLKAIVSNQLAQNISTFLYLSM